MVLLLEAHVALKLFSKMALCVKNVKPAFGAHRWLGCCLGLSCALLVKSRPRAEDKLQENIFVFCYQLGKLD